MPEPPMIGEEITILSKTIVEYGAFSVILAFALILVSIIVIFTFKTSKKDTSNLIGEMHEQSEQDRQMLSDLLKALIPKYNDEDLVKKDIVKNYIEINNVFGSISKETLFKIKADRVGVYVFHNGNHSAHGLPFFKMSCIGEWIVHGTGILQGKTHMDLPLHMFSDIIEKLYVNKEYCNNTAASSVAIILKDFLQNPKINFVYILGIYDSLENLAGFIIAEFKENQDNQNIQDIIKPTVNNMANNISGIIINSNIKDKLNQA